ncbi:hypothetical protein NC653_038302 [Populus alba x Populus x berolinensis]|uniref:Uncharacterized protein n=1 Tax=Populus alba x Populus x berolinensis TaxID=444605 RepID=A0AAD6PTZ3_9ROSI|nr:hypothetical protein NC653_038302 [Populus alba x Populus x berolinensis]
MVAAEANDIACLMVVLKRTTCRCTNAPASFINLLAVIPCPSVMEGGSLLNSLTTTVIISCWIEWVLN